MKNIQNKANKQNTPAEKKWGEKLGKRTVIRSMVTVERRALYGRYHVEILMNIIFNSYKNTI